MKIIVSIKQVPDTSGKVAVNPDVILTVLTGELPYRAASIGSACF